MCNINVLCALERVCSVCSARVGMHSVRENLSDEREQNKNPKREEIEREREKERKSARVEELDK